jgi:hypothetical protein
MKPAPGEFAAVSHQINQSPYMMQYNLNIQRQLRQNMVLTRTKITERLNMQFRAEFFNVLNHFNLGTPTDALGVTGETPTGYSSMQAGNPRQIQFALKFDF